MSLLIENIAYCWAASILLDCTKANFRILGGLGMTFNRAFKDIFGSELTEKGYKYSARNAKSWYTDSVLILFF